jgi:hypothetical protein
MRITPVRDFVKMTETKQLDGHGYAAHLTKRDLQMTPESLARGVRPGRHGLAYIKAGRILRHDLDKHRATSEEG